MPNFRIRKGYMALVTITTPVSSGIFFQTGVVLMVFSPNFKSISRG